MYFRRDRILFGCLEFGFTRGMDGDGIMGIGGESAKTFSFPGQNRPANR
jgi:hypothetical protein